MSDDEDFEEEQARIKRRNNNFFDDAPAASSLQRNESKSKTASPAGVAFSAARGDVSMGTGDAVRSSVTKPSLLSTPTASSPATRSSIAGDPGRLSIVNQTSALAIQPGRSSLTGSSTPSLARESTVGELGRSSVSSANLAARDSSSPTPAEQPHRHFTNAALNQASANSQRRQSFQISHGPSVTNPNEAVRLLLVGDSDQRDRRETPIVCLEQFRSLSSKKKLFAAALATHDGNVLLTVLRFLRSTLDFDLFAALLQSDSDAARHYLFYLKQCNNIAEVNRLNARLETVDASLLEKDQIDPATKLAQEIRQRAVLDKFGAIIGIESTDKRKEAFYKFANSESSHSPLLADYAKKSAALLEIQQKLDAIEAVESKNNSSFVYSEFPLTGVTVGKSLGDTLRHCAIYHLSMDPNICSSCEKKEPPIHLNAACLRKYFNVSDKVFQVALVRALTHSRRYDLIDKILAPKGITAFFSGNSKKVKPAVSPDRVIDVIMYTLKQCNRLGVSLPANVRNYLELLEDADTLESLACEYKLYEIVTEIYCQRRDRARLNHFIHKIPQDNSERDRAKYRLQDPSIKWKN